MSASATLGGLTATAHMLPAGVVRLLAEKRGHRAPPVTGEVCDVTHRAIADATGVARLRRHCVLLVGCVHVPCSMAMARCQASIGTFIGVFFHPQNTLKIKAIFEPSKNFL